MTKSKQQELKLLSQWIHNVTKESVEIIGHSTTTKYNKLYYETVTILSFSGTRVTLDYSDFVEQYTNVPPMKKQSNHIRVICDE